MVILCRFAPLRLCVRFMILTFPDFDALRLAMTSGAVPPAVAQSAAVVGFDNQNHVWVETAAPSRRTERPPPPRRPALQGQRRSPLDLCPLLAGDPAAPARRRSARPTGTDADPVRDGRPRRPRPAGRRDPASRQRPAAVPLAGKQDRRRRGPRPAARRRAAVLLAAPRHRPQRPGRPPRLSGAPPRLGRGRLGPPAGRPPQAAAGQAAAGRPAAAVDAPRRGAVPRRVRGDGVCAARWPDRLERGRVEGQGAAPRSS